MFCISDEVLKGIYFFLYYYLYKKLWNVIEGGLFMNLISVNFVKLFNLRRLKKYLNFESNIVFRLFMDFIKKDFYGNS